MISALGCLTYVVIAYKSKHIVVMNKYRPFCSLLENSPFVYNIYRDEYYGRNSGLSECMLKSIIPGFNTSVFVGLGLYLIVNAVTLVIRLAYANANKTLILYLDKVLLKRVEDKKKSVLQ